MAHHQPLPSWSSFALDHAVKRSPSEFDLTPFLTENDNNNSGSNNNSNKITGSAPAVAELEGYDHQQPAPNFGLEDAFSFKFEHDDPQDIMNEFGGLGEPSTWYQSLTSSSPPYCVSAIDSQSSMCGGSPTSTLKPKAGDNQGSMSSEDEIEEVEQSNHPNPDKRLRRMESNRQSARRSRRRKQEHLQELETQVELLSGENVQLLKQLGNAAQHLQHASTDNRVLKSDVEALRAKVKLAEDKVTRGSIQPSLNHILQTQLGTQPQMVNPQSFARLGPISSSVALGGQDGGSIFEMVSGIMTTADSVSEDINSMNGMLVGNTTVDGLNSCLTQMWH